MAQGGEVHGAYTPFGHWMTLGGTIMGATVSKLATITHKVALTKFAKATLVHTRSHVRAKARG